MADDGRRALLENQTLVRHVKMLQAELVRARQYADAQQRRAELAERSAQNGFKFAAWGGARRRDNATKAED